MSDYHTLFYGLSRPHWWRFREWNIRVGISSPGNRYWSDTLFTGNKSAAIDKLVEIAHTYAELTDMDEAAIRERLTS